MANYSFKPVKDLPDVKDGHEFVGDNFTQLIPHTKIFEGKKGLRFVKCNLTNCDYPADAELIGCSPKHCEFCSHVHPNYVTKYGLAECAQNCSHLTQTDKVTIDGQVIDEVRHYADKPIAAVEEERG